MHASVPKPLVPVNGRPMLDHVVALYERYVTHTVVVAHPTSAAQIGRWADERGGAEVVQQPEPTGMLDAILLAQPAVMRLRPAWIWITWCDQVGVLPHTIERLARETSVTPPPALVLPTVRLADPYTHFERDADGRIMGFLQRREGDSMPAAGESDMGLFALSGETFDTDLAEYARNPAIGAATRERLFVPFVAWLARRRTVVTFPCTDPMEAVGINTPDDLHRVEAWLRERGR